MADKTKIEWSDATWNVITGCSPVSPGCANCYAAQLAGTRLKNHPSRAGLTKCVNGKPVWTGEVRFNEEWLRQPLSWKKPRRIFVCAHGDLFHEAVKDEWLDQIFAVMAQASHHTFQILTKRPERMRCYLQALYFGRLREVEELKEGFLQNVWIGVTVENQEQAEARIPLLLQAQAEKHFISVEPMLGPIRIDTIRTGIYTYVLPLDGECLQSKNEDNPVDTYRDKCPRIDWVICGGESGPNARPVHPDWVRSLRDQCKEARVPFFFKQWGEWWPSLDYTEKMIRVGKTSAGRLLDGKEYLEVPV